MIQTKNVNKIDLFGNGGGCPDGISSPFYLKKKKIFPLFYLQDKIFVLTLHPQNRV